MNYTTTVVSHPVTTAVFGVPPLYICLHSFQIREIALAFDPL